MFLGRTSELNYLNAFYDSEGSQLLVVYGQKNIGKTSLLKEFVKGKPYHYYCARSASEREQTYEWGKELTDHTGDLPEYPSYAEIFRKISGDESGKTVMIVDEFQHAVKSGNAFMKDLVSFVQGSEKHGEILVVLSSSSTGWVENSMVMKIGESAYALSGFLKIKELPFEEMRHFFPKFSAEQCVEAYAVLGGFPGLWTQFDDSLNMKENICRFVLNPHTYLQEEGLRTVAEELRETAVYHTILSSIAAGRHKLNDLYRHTGFSRAKISVYLKNLMELELVEKVFSFDTEGKANSQKGIYRISNHFVHFYFRFLYPNRSALALMSADEFYEKNIQFSFKNFAALYFNEICKQRIEKWNKEEKLPIAIDRIGEWVGKSGNIDVVAQDENGKTLAACCNWEKSVMQYGDYEKLLSSMGKAKLKADTIYLFSIQRFDEKLSLEAKMKKNLKLISLEDM